MWMYRISLHVDVNIYCRELAAAKTEVCGYRIPDIIILTESGSLELFYMNIASIETSIG